MLHGHSSDYTAENNSTGHSLEGPRQVAYFLVLHGYTHTFIAYVPVAINIFTVRLEM